VRELQETGRFWHRWEATHVVLGLIALVIVVMVILVVLILANG
jgi:energy-coupling factor transporter transmembrane protein EcfT